MFMENTFVKKFYIGINDVDANRLLTPRATLLFLQDVATEHANTEGFGYDHLMTVNRFWVLTKMKLVFLRAVKAYETLSVETWPLEANKLYADRDFVARDESGKLVIKATSRWCVVDAIARKLARTADVKDFVKLEHRTDRALGDEQNNYLRVIPDDTFLPAYSLTTRWTDIDCNWHVNNTRYADFAINAVPHQTASQNTLVELEAHYSQELKLNDTIQLLLKTENEISQVIGRGDDNVVRFSVRMKFAPKKLT